MMRVRWNRIVARGVLVAAAACLMAGCSPGGGVDNGGGAGNAGDDAASGVNAAHDGGRAVSEGDGDGLRDDGQPQHLEKVPVLIRHQKGGGEERLSIELALTREQQEKGLMHRTALARGEGMLFPFLPPRNVSFWMKHTQVPLDLVFIRPDGRVAKVAAQARPNDPTPIFADVPVAGVLELRGGDARAFGIGEGDWIGWGRCTAQPVRNEARETSFCQPR